MYTFEDLDVGTFNFAKGAKGTDEAGDSVKFDKFIKKHGALAVKEVSIGGNLTLQAADGALIRTRLDAVTNSDNIMKLKVQTPDGVKTIGEILNGGAAAPTGSSGIAWSK